MQDDDVEVPTHSDSSENETEIAGKSETLTDFSVSIASKERCGKNLGTNLTASTSSAVESSSNVLSSLDMEPDKIVAEDIEESDSATDVSEPEETLSEPFEAFPHTSFQHKHSVKVNKNF
jgi:hypothetical protein